MLAVRTRRRQRGIAAYPGKGDRFDRAIAEFAATYADLNERDHRALVRAIADGRIAGVEGSSHRVLPPVVTWRPCAEESDPWWSSWRSSRFCPA
jgi:hypothetical protein